MAFTSLVFCLFLAAVLLVYWVVPRKVRAPWLLVASYAFCLSFSGIALAVLLFTTLVSWAAALRLHRAPPGRRRWWLVAGVVLTLVPLVFFKYYAFWVGVLNPLLAALPDSAYHTLTNLLLPVGISFYTFQVLGYLLDVARGRQEPETNLLRYALYVSFFPKLTQGPIERGASLLPQIQTLESLHVWDTARFQPALVTILWGLFEKLVLADRLGVFVDNVFGHIDACGTMELVGAALAYTLQIYLDFSGYTCIALGVGQLLGFRLTENFNTPYFATSISDFWRRWHISLSTWFRDYLYIPLGGSHCGTARRCFNSMLTMLVSGIWHGSTWNFVVWGLLHGFYLTVAQLTRPARQAFRQRFSVGTNSFSYRLGQRLCTFFLVAFAWIFFRAENLTQAFAYLHRMLTRWNPWVLFDGTFYGAWTGIEVPVLWLGLALVLAVDILRSRRGLSLPDWLRGQNLWFRWCFYLGLFVAIVVFGEYGIDFQSSQFLYFQF